jgi:hypothetical protein
MKASIDTALNIVIASEVEGLGMTIFNFVVSVSAYSLL